MNEKTLDDFFDYLNRMNDNKELTLGKHQLNDNYKPRKKSK